MVQKFANAARGVLASAIAPGTTTIEITEGGDLFPLISGNEWFKSVLQDADGIEIIRVNARTGNVFTVVRGQEGTTARAFAAGSVVGLRVTALDMELALSGGEIISRAYDTRGDLRTLTNVAQDSLAVVDGLGLFQFSAGSDEPDDDESCFATATGRWLLEAVHWDVVSTWQMPDDDARDVFDEDDGLRFDARFGARVLHGIAVNAITTLASISTASFTGTVTGAAVGDRVLITPRAEIGQSVGDTARLAFYGTVSAADTVRITLVNPSAATVTINAAVIGAGNPWSIAVLKHI